MTGNKGFLKILPAEEAGDNSRLDDFRKLYEQHEAYVRKTLYWMVGPNHASDLLQEVFIKVWNSLENFRGEASMKTWIHRVAVNTVYDFWRARARAGRRGNLELERLPDPRNMEREVFVREVIARGIRRMPENLQSVFVLFYYQEFSLLEVAETLEIAEGTVKSRLHQARESFKEYLLKSGVSYE